MKIQFNKIYVLILAAFLTSVVVFAGNGEGYNGPDLSGDSIPVALDRSITLAQVTRAYETCMNRRVEHLAEQVCRTQENEVSVEVSFYAPNNLLIPRLSASAKPLGSLEKCFRFYTSSGTDYLSFTSYSSSDNKSYQLSYECERGEYPSVNYNLPYFIFDSTVIEVGGIDDFGDVNKSAITYKGLKLNIPKQECIRPDVKLYNLQTYQETSFIFNIEAYKECLLHEISQ